MKKFLFVILFLPCMPFMAMADEGMWLPFLLKNNQADMQRKGLLLNASDIYNEDTVSLKDAVVKFGSGCTGGIVSNSGLLFTNHHCGFDYIQQLSTLEHNYLENGFWASSFDEELLCKGLSVTRLVKMIPVTDELLSDLPLNISERDRKDSVKVRSKRLCDKAETEAAHYYKAEIVPFYGGNEYYMLINEVFEDIRLVGTPPVSIGKFGGDTDNWMFPRHTGDFSVFRIYVDSANKPAPYSADNKPYTPLTYFKISLDEKQDGDFTFVMGYPARTNEYLSAYAVQQQIEEDKMRIDARTKRLDIIKSAMATDSAVRLQYASKAANIANGWKKWQGEVIGVERNKTVADKEKYEAQIADIAGDLLNNIAQCYVDVRPYKKATVLFTECELAPEVMRFAYSFQPLVKTADNAALITTAIKRAEKFFKDYNADVDKQIFETMLGGIESTMLGGVAVQKQINEFYAKSIFTNEKRLQKVLNSGELKQIAKDPLYIYACGRFAKFDSDIKPMLEKYSAKIDSLQRLYIKLLIAHGCPVPEMATDSTPLIYADANFTLRIAYGNIKGFTPKDGVYYEPFSTLNGVIEKAATGIYDYVLDEKLKELYDVRDYGNYARKDNEMPVCFIATNHTTGGNSGSPVLNAKGELTGLNFDRNWEGTMSDIDYDINYCRNITLDIRYVLFIIDKFAGCRRLINEIKVNQ
jgi:hypothetical protein